MKKYLSFADKCLSSLTINLASLMLVLVTFFVFGEVIFRYVLKIPMGGIGELPIVLMILCVWCAAVINFREDSHIEIRVMGLMIKNQKVLNCIKLFNRLITLVVLLFFAYLSLEYLQYSFESGQISPGLRFPQWWLVAIMAVSSVLMVIYTIRNFIKDLKEVFPWK